MPHQIITREEFIEIHTKDGPRMFDSKQNASLFPDGAVIKSMGEFMPPMLHEPPTDQAALLRLQYRYVQLRLNDEINAFDNFKAECNSRQPAADWGFVNIVNVPGPPADAADQLKRGAARIQSLRERLKQLDAELGKQPEEAARRAQLQAQRRADEEGRRKLRNRQQEINNVTY